MIERSVVDVSVVASPGEATVLTVRGTLDSSTYREVRDSVIKAALAEPTAVVVDVTELRVPAHSAWTVFTSARWHVSTWPDIPVMLVCADGNGRASIKRSGATRYVPVYADADSARAAVSAPQRIRKRASAELEAGGDSPAQTRRLVTRWLTAWGLSEMIPTASTVATVFVENVLEHTASRPRLIVETSDGGVTVAVSDDSQSAAARHEDPDSGAHTVSGLAIVAVLSRSWGSTPTANGKTVWAVLGPENRL
ncbi:sulfate transporter [Mycobacterium sp. ITM-2016-00317]|uniref:STAS domain-containing protein n=1 Tax=Mycobacterium sp. ITM-2016-00317 TaxID=2099694 RepID=UPI00287F715C|nr:STAS domain-containing protein [Mycobacterium sp. ITM-2016-00317]WNG90113.1 sulfate transporter [Mycobacterium sp. ITM-2016-00317]